MRERTGVTFTLAALLAAQVSVAADQGPPASASILPAHPAWTSDPVRKCPDMRVADDGAATVVVFLVSSAGVPSRAATRSSSGSEVFDMAAINCVLRLRFQAATRVGDGVPIESWQAIGWRQVNPPQRLTDATAMAGQPAVSAGPPSAAAIATPQRDAAGGQQPAAGRAVSVRVCSDLTGKLTQEPQVTHSSGDQALDEAAVKIARSGSAYYQPAPSAGAAPVSGCAQLQIQFESR